MMAGYIKLHRGWHDDEIFRDDYCERAAWTWLLSNAAWKETQRRTVQGGVVTLQRGEIHVSLGSLAATFGWSIKRVRGFIDRLEKGHMVGTQKGKAGTVLTILKYGKYQDGDNDAGTPEGTQKGTVGAQSGHTQEEGKEIKEEKKEGGYAFEGHVIRLNFADYRRWQNAFPDLDLRAQLTSRDDWFRSQPDDTQRRWFNSTSNWLAKRQQEVSAASRADPMAGFIC